jgi:hypothetical protein
MMMKRALFATAALAAVFSAAPAAAQYAPTRLSVEPYVGYGFFGSLPDTGTKLEGAVAYGGRAAYQFSPQWAVFGNYQRSQPEVTGSIAGINTSGGNVNVDHWAAGVEFSYVPRGGAEGMLPIIMEAGLGQARYEGGINDLAVKLGLSSQLQLSRNLGIRYGVDDYISNFDKDRGIVNQIFARVGAEIAF